MIVELVLMIILSLSLSAGFLWLSGNYMIAGLDYAASFVNTSFSGRSYLIQTIIYIILFLVIGCVFFFVLRVLSRTKSGISKSIILLCILIIISLLIALCFKQTLRRDDFWETHDAQKYGFPGFLVLEFTQVNGRYFSLLLRSMYNFFDPETYIHIALSVNILFLFGACTYLSDVLLRIITAKHSRLMSALCGTGFAMIALFVSPKIWEVWFWGSGTFVYGVGITLGIAILALYLDACSGHPHIYLTILCISCVCGCSELVTASICALGFGLIMINWLIGNGKQNKFIILYFLWSIVCTGIVLMFSSSVKLAGGFSGTGSNFFAAYLYSMPGLLQSSIQMLWQYFYSRLEYIVLLTGVFFILGTSVKARKIKYIPFIFGIMLMVLTAVFSLTMNLMMNYVPGRVITIPLIWLEFSLAVISFFFGTKVNQNNSLSYSKFSYTACSLLFCVLTLHLFTNNYSLLCDIYDAWHVRDAEIRAIEDKSQPITVCTIPVIGSIDRDLLEDPDFEMNLVAAVYYRVPQIIGGDPCPPFDH